MKSPYWKLVQRIAVPCNLEEWTPLLEHREKNWTVACTELDEEVFVSTVFLGLDHNYSSVGDPLLFETMVLGEEKISRGLGRPFTYREDLGQWRYSTWADAENGHNIVCQAVRKRLEEARQVADASMNQARSSQPGTSGERASEPDENGEENSA